MDIRRLTHFIALAEEGRFAVAAIVSAVVVVLHRNPVVSTMSLVVTLVASAGLFIMLTYCAAQYFIVSGYINRKS